MTFNLPSNTTVDKMGAKTISIHITEHEKTNFTVVLTCMVDETKLSLIVIFKLKKILKGNFSPKVIIYTNLTGWMNKNEMLYQIKNVWVKRAILSNLQSLLVLDSFSAHIVDSVKRHFCEKNYQYYYYSRKKKKIFFIYLILNYIYKFIFYRYEKIIMNGYLNL